MCKWRVVAATVTAVVAWFCLSVGSLAQETSPTSGPSVQLVVTAEPQHGNNPPQINRNEVMVYEGSHRDTVTNWIPAQGDHAGLQLFLLIDNEANTSLGSQLQDIKQFINSQPSSALIGVAYMQNGSAQIAQNLTSDHQAAAKALHLPMGVPGVNASPYFSLSDLVKHWPAAPSDVRREVLMISDGIDRYYGWGDMQDPYVGAAIDAAGKAGIVVSAIYTPGAGHFSHSYWASYWGQMYLSQVADQTGGEAYYIGFTGAPVSFSPYLEQLGRRLQNQYLLSFIPQPQNKAGFQRVRLDTEVPNVDLVSAGRVYVPAQK